MSAPPAYAAALGRALAEPAFFTAFSQQFVGDAGPLDALRWLEDATAIGSDGRPGPGVAEREARIRLFRPDVSARDREEHARVAGTLATLRAQTVAALEAVARGEDAGERGPAEAVAHEAETRRSPHRGSRRWLGAAVAGGALLLTIVVGGNLLDQGPSPVDRSVAVASDAPLARVIGARTELLPAGWRGGTVVSSSDELDGALALLAPAGEQGRLLLVVRCPASDRSFQAVVTGGGPSARRYGACGHLQTVALPVRPDALVRVVVTSRGIEPFSGALVRR